MFGDVNCIAIDSLLQIYFLSFLWLARFVFDWPVLYWWIYFLNANKWQQVYKRVAVVITCPNSTDSRSKSECLAVNIVNSQHISATDRMTMTSSVLPPPCCRSTLWIIVQCKRDKNNSNSAMAAYICAWDYRNDPETCVVDWLVIYNLM